MASPGSQAASRTDPGSRGTKSSSGKSSGSGSYTGQGRPNTVATAGPAITGLRGPTDASGQLAGHTTSVLGAGGAYQGAVADYGNKGWLGRQMNVTPDPSRPATYANGIAHFGMNIPGALLGTAAGVFAPGIGMPAGMALGAGFRAMGIPDTVFGSGSPANPMPGQGFNYSGTGPQGRYGPGTGTQQAQGLGQQPGAGDHLQQLAQLNSQIPGNPGAPVNSGTAQTPAAPAGPNYLQRMGRMQSVTPNYGVNLPTYQYSGRATV